MSSPCRLDADAAAEPLVATAPERVSAWLLVEHGGPWGREVPHDAAAMPAGDRAVLADVVREVPGLKVVFTRRAGLGPRAASLTFVRPQGPTSAPAMLLGWREWPARVSWRLASETGMAEALRALAAGPASPQAAALDALRDDDASPRWLVCTHGTRDACCARWGRALLPELARSGEVFRESSHLGGHRFAPVVLDLETGVMLGRLEEGQLYEAVMQARGGQVPALDRWRGRTTLSRFEQAAECHVRGARGLHGRHDVIGVRTEHTSGTGPETVATVSVELGSGGTVTVSTRWSEPRLIFGSCGDDARTAFRAVVVDAGVD